MKQLLKTAPRVATNGHRSLYHEVGLVLHEKAICGTALL